MHSHTATRRTRATHTLLPCRLARLTRPRVSRVAGYSGGGYGYYTPYGGVYRSTGPYVTNFELYGNSPTGYGYGYSAYGSNYYRPWGYGGYGGGYGYGRGYYGRGYGYGNFGISSQFVGSVASHGRER